MHHFTVPTIQEVAQANQAIFDNLNRQGATALHNFYAAGYTKGSLEDVILAVADKVVMNNIHNITQVPIDFPITPELKMATA